MSSGKTSAASAGGGTIELVRSVDGYLNANNNHLTETFSPGIDAAIVDTGVSVLVTRGEYNVTVANSTIASLSDDGSTLSIIYDGFGTMNISFKYTALRIS